MNKKVDRKKPEYINNKLKVSSDVWFEKGYIKAVDKGFDTQERAIIKFYNERGVEVSRILKNNCFFTTEELQEFL